MYGVPRINGNLAVGRAIGDASVGKGMNARPKITRVYLSTISPESQLFLACDGVFDVASTRQVGTALRENRGISAKKLARNIVYSAYQAGSGDNLSAMVIKFPSQKIDRRRIVFWDFFKGPRKQMETRQ